MALPPDSMYTLARPGITVDLSSTFLFCCGIGWNGTDELMGYQGINASADRWAMQGCLPRLLIYL